MFDVQSFIDICSWGLFDNKPTLDQVIVWNRAGNKSQTITCNNDYPAYWRIYA